MFEAYILIGTFDTQGEAIEALELATDENTKTLIKETK